MDNQLLTFGGLLINVWARLEIGSHILIITGINLGSINLDKFYCTSKKVDKNINQASNWPP
jgi:hypothetical protein